MINELLWYYTNINQFAVNGWLLYVVLKGVKN
jgi:hypothetical protein